MLVRGGRIYIYKSMMYYASISKMLSIWKSSLHMLSVAGICSRSTGFLRLLTHSIVICAATELSLTYLN